MIQTKLGVKFNGVKPETVLGITIASSVYRDFGYDFILTSVCDGEHSRGSLHYAGLGFDCRTWHIKNDELDKVFKVLKDALGEQWDVIKEETHIHCEFQPK